MSWYQRRDAALAAAAELLGWGCVRLPGERHIGRVLMFAKPGYRAGFYPTTSSAYSVLGAALEARQVIRTRLLPK